ncbi:MAG TPA: aldo/keto reductase [Rhabdochlamydiaceae bacterium]|nr:aldo/keto reductase [Rhabdochlamydiaceae bacterium]
MKAQYKLKIPVIGLGTYKLLGATCVKVVKEALDIGYRHFDTAQVYENHKAVAEGLQGFDRSTLFITSKLALEQVDDDRITQSVTEACDLALKELKTDYLDLYLIHWPDHQRPMVKILEAMQGLKKTGKVRHVGVSNYTIHHLQDALDAKLAIECNQVEFHPYLYQKELLEFCNRHQICLCAYRPFGQGKLLEDEPLFAKIGKKYGKSAAQVILRWCIQKNIPVIPKSSSKKRLAENFAIFDFSLSQKEMQLLDELNKNYRYCVPECEDFDY